MASAASAVCRSTRRAGLPRRRACAASLRAHVPLLFDTSGPGAGHELFTVTGVAARSQHDAPNPPFERAYAAGQFDTSFPSFSEPTTSIAPNRRLMLYDGYSDDMPLIDNVVDVGFSYFADNAAASVTLPPDGGATASTMPARRRSRV